MKLIKLKNGTEEVEVLVKSTMGSLRGMIHSNPIHFLEFVYLVRDKNHEVWGGETTLQSFIAIGLMNEDLTIHGSIRNIVLSAVEGDGLDMCLVNPKE